MLAASSIDAAGRCWRVDRDLLIELHPRLYHMAEGGSWPSIVRHGLLSTSALLETFEVVDDRAAIESARRGSKTTISHPVHGEAVIRDQKPMIESRLERCLTDGMVPREWYELLNSFVFFWLTEERLFKLLGARPYRNLEHDVLILDTAHVIEDYADRIYLAPYNTGSTAYEPPRRGRETFRPIEDYPYDEWRANGRGRREAVVEFVVSGGVTNIRDYLIQVERRRGVQLLEVIWI
jgi:hypothetical protein